LNCYFPEKLKELKTAANFDLQLYFILIFFLIYDSLFRSI